MKIFMVSDNPFGLIGTPGTYLLSREMACLAQLVVFCPSPKPDDMLVFSSSNFSGDVIFQDRSSSDWQIAFCATLSADKPDIVYFASGRGWCQNDGEFLRLIKNSWPSVRIVVDLKSPYTVSDKKQVARLQKRSNTALKYVDIVLSRCTFDVFERFGHLRVPFKLYPIGVSEFSGLGTFEIEASGCHAKDENGRLKAVFIGSLSDKRKLDLMLEEVSLIRKALLDHFQLDIYGEGSDRARLESKVTSLGLTETIHFRGLVSQENLLAALPAYDVGVAWVPYEMYDSAPSLKAVEYLSAGLIPVLSDTRAHLQIEGDKYFVKFFSNRMGSLACLFENLIESDISCFNPKLEQNMEAVSNQNWKNVVCSYIFPFLADLVSAESANKVFSIEEYFSHGQNPVLIMYFSEHDFVDWSERLYVWLRPQVGAIQVVVRENGRWLKKVYAGSNPAFGSEDNVSESEVCALMNSNEFQLKIGVVSDYHKAAPYFDHLELSNLLLIETLSPERMVADDLTVSRSPVSRVKKEIRDSFFVSSSAVFSPGGYPVSSVEVDLQVWGYELFSVMYDEVCVKQGHCSAHLSAISEERNLRSYRSLAHMHEEGKDYLK